MTTACHHHGIPVSQGIMLRAGANWPSHPPARAEWKCSQAAKRCLHGGHPLIGQSSAELETQDQVSPILQISILASLNCSQARTKRTTASWSLCAKKQRMSNATAGPNKCQVSARKCSNAVHSNTRWRSSSRAPGGASGTKPLRRRNPRQRLATMRRA